MRLAWLLSCYVCLTSITAAQDTIVFWQKPIGSGHSVIFDQAIVELRGQVLQFDSQLLEIKSDGEVDSRKYASDQIAGLQVRWESEQARAANTAYLDSQWLESVRAAQAAVAQPELPIWQQKLLSLQIVSALTNFDRIELATKVFLLVRKQNAPFLSYTYLPIPWVSTNASPMTLAAVKTIVEDQDPAAQLIAASWLIDTAEREKATTILQRIAASNEYPLNQLAATQLWRTSVPTSFVEKDLINAVKTRDALPLCLQLGPTAAIADRIERAGELETAIPFWIEVVTRAEQLHLPIFPVAVAHLEDLCRRTNRTKDWEAIRESLQR